MKKYLAIAIFLFSALIPARAQNPPAYQVELACPAGSNPLNPVGTTWNASTGKYRQWLCVDSNGNVYGAGGGAAASLSVIYANNYGVIGGAQQGCTAIFSNVSHTVTTGAGDPPVSNADIGSIIVGSSNACGGNNGAYTGGAIVGASCPPTCPTITGVTSPHIFTISVLPSSSAGDGTTCCIWAKGKVDDGPALQAAYNAAIANCPATLELPGTSMLIGAPIFVSSFPCGNAIQIEGNGSMLLVLPGFDATAVPGSVGMFFGIPGAAPQNAYFRNFSVSGLGVYTVTGAASKIALYVTYAALVENVGFYQWGTNTAGMLSVYCGTSADSMGNLHNVITYNGPPMDIGPACYGDHLFHLTRFGVQIGPSGSADVYTNDSQFYAYSSGTFAAAAVSGSGNWISTADSFFGNSGMNGITYNGGNPTVSIYLNQDNVAAGGTGLIPNSTGAVFHLHQTRVSGTTNSLGGASAGSKIFDDCGNTMGANGNWANTALFNSCSVTGTALVAGNVGLTSGWSTSTVTAVGAGSDSHKGTFTITAAGTPGLNPTITLTFPAAFWVAPTYCTLQQVGGTLGVLTVPLNAAGTPTATSDLFTLSGTPVATQTYTFSYGCQ